MTNHNHLVRILTVLIISFSFSFHGIGQETGFSLTGKILESGSGIPLEQAVLSLASSSEFATADEDGSFSITLPSAEERIMVSFPGYHSTEVFTNGKTDIVIYLTPLKYESADELFSSPLGVDKIKNATNAVTMLSKPAFESTASSSFEQCMAGKVAGLKITEHSGMPGHQSWINLRGISSIFARNEPVVFIDGMIHEINYPYNSIIEGHILNPMDIMDVDDIVDVSVIKAGEGYLGGIGSNGIINVNSEQNQVTSASIILKMYGGVALRPESQDVMNPDQFKPYFESLLGSEGYSGWEINQMYPWLYGGTSAPEYYRYNNNTDWQKDMFSASALQKYYIFIKGGDDIATYNISSGFLRHGTAYDNWKYSRYTLRLNGKINITNKLYVIPNTKLALSDSYLTNMGPTSEHNPVTSTVQKSPLMTAHQRSDIDGTSLYPYDDVGAFNISNPASLIDGGMGSDRNFQLLASAKVGYNFNSKFALTNLIGISVNNDRANIFIPELGVVQLDSARNSPQDMVTEFRSFQNHTTLAYKNTINEVHQLNFFAGIRIMQNTYKNSIGIDLNTPSDNFRSLGQGAEYEYLRENGGQLNELSWVSYFGDFNYNFRSKYYLRASVSYDGSSVINEANRYNFYPSIFGAWRLSSEDFLSGSSWLSDMKLRASFSQTGNMFSSAYGLSKMTYTGRRYNDIGVVVRNYNPNSEMEIEKKTTINAGLDFSFAKNAYNLHIDYYMSSVNNLIVNQLLPYNYGFTDYLDNGGSLSMNGIEVAADGRMHIGQSVLTLDATVTYQTSKIKSFDFMNPDTKFLTTEVEGAEYIASEGNPINSFYGFKTNGIYNSDAEANGLLGPNGRVMGAGDIIFVDTDGNNIIDDKDKQIIGDPNPDLFGSLSAALNVKRFDFSLLFTYSVGNELVNYMNYKLTAMMDYSNQSTDVLDRWQPGSTNATLPKAAIGDPNGNTAFSDRYIEDGSYLRIREARISYTTPRMFNLEKEVKFYITGTNLFTFTKYSGYDPETMNHNSPYAMGIDYGIIPLARSVIVGIQLNL